MEENILIVERTNILEILNIKNDALKTIIRKKQLKERLNEKGYILLEEFKEGRKTLYKLEHYGELSDNKFKLNNAMECIFNTTKDEDKHTDYIMYRCANIYKPLSKKHLAEKLGVNEKTIRKWDNNMLYNNLLAKDGYFYLVGGAIKKYEFNESKTVIENYSEKFTFDLNNDIESSLLGVDSSDIIEPLNNFGINSNEYKNEPGFPYNCSIITKQF